MSLPFVLALLTIAWVGHACIWTSVLNYVYARPYPKKVLKVWRHFTGLVILAFPVASFFIDPDPELAPSWVILYLGVCLFPGGLVFPTITIQRLLRNPTRGLLLESSTTLDLWKELGPEAIGDGKGRLAARLPFNDIYPLDFTDLVLALPKCPRSGTAFPSCT